MFSVYMHSTQECSHTTTKSLCNVYCIYAYTHALPHELKGYVGLVRLLPGCPWDLDSSFKTLAHCISYSAVLLQIGRYTLYRRTQQEKRGEGNFTLTPPPTYPFRNCRAPVNESGNDFQPFLLTGPFSEKFNQILFAITRLAEQRIQQTSRIPPSIKTHKTFSITETYKYMQNIYRICLYIW